MKNSREIEKHQKNLKKINGVAKFSNCRVSEVK